MERPVVSKAIIDNWKTFLPYLGAYFITYGALSAATYYYSFNVDIFHYIEFGEIITYFLNDIHIIIVHVFIMLILIQLHDPVEKSLKGTLNRVRTISNRISASATASMEKLNDNEAELQRLLDEAEAAPNDEEKLAMGTKARELFETMKTELSQVTRTIRKYQVRIAIIRTGIKIFMVLLTTASLVGFLYVLGVATGSLFLAPLIITAIFTFKVKDFRILALTYTALAILFSSISGAIIKAHHVKKGSHYGYEFRIENEVFKSDSSSYFIGKTNNYLFYYNALEGKTSVYQTDKIDIIKIPPKRGMKFKDWLL